MTILISKTSKGELPLRQPSPPPGMRRANESEAPFFAGPSESSLNPTSQNEMLGTIPGSFPKEPPFVSQMQGPPKLQQSTLTPSPIADPPEFALHVYSNELGSLPLHRRVSFSAQAHNSHSQTHSSQVHPQTDYWYSMPHNGSERFEPTPLAGPSGASSSYWLHHAEPSAPPLQQHQSHDYPHPRHVPRSIPTVGFSSTSGASPMAQGSYGAVLLNMGASVSLESSLGHIQLQSPEYSLRPMDLLSTSTIGSNATALLPPPSHGDSSMPISTPGHPTYHQHQGVPQQGESYYPFALEANTVALWSDAPTGFQCAVLCSFFVAHLTFSFAEWKDGVPTLGK